MTKFPPLLLRNGDADQNMCSLNSNLQLPRRVPNFVSELNVWKDSSDMINALIDIFSYSALNDIKKQVLEMKHVKDKLLVDVLSAYKLKSFMSNLTTDRARINDIDFT